MLPLKKGTKKSGQSRTFENYLDGLEEITHTDREGI